MKACFIGHRNIDRTETLKSKLKETVLTLINKGVTTFLFGSMSDFDKLSLEVVSELKGNKFGETKHIIALCVNNCKGYNLQTNFPKGYITYLCVKYKRECANTPQGS